MGTSKRKVNEKIKELLKKNISGKSKIDKISIDDYIPQKNISRYTQTRDFSALLTGGLSIQRSIAQGDFSNLPFNKQDLENKDSLNLQRLKEDILGLIEKEIGQDIEPSLITNSFNNTMAKVIMENITDPIEYLKIFCENFLFYVLLENTNESIIDLFTTDEEIKIFRAKEQDEIRQYIYDNLLDHINDLISKKITIEDFINIISRK